MTKSETISNLKAYLDGDMAIGNIIPLRSILESAIKYLEPSLPSDLDEAAEKFNREDAARMWDYEGKSEGEIVEAAFKAGAEWMAGQGVTVEGIFKAGDPGYPDVRMGEQYSIEYISDKPSGIEPGDEVVVQFRKK